MQQKQTLEGEADPSVKSGFKIKRRKKRAALYLAIDRRVKKSCSADMKQQLERKVVGVEATASKKDARALYQIIRDLTGTKSNSNVPIKDKHGKVLLTEEA